jgi:hypothetical protein
MQPHPPALAAGGGLLAYLTGDEVVIPTMVIAGAGDSLRTSPILMP